MGPLKSDPVSFFRVNVGLHPVHAGTPKRGVAIYSPKAFRDIKMTMMPSVHPTTLSKMLAALSNGRGALYVLTPVREHAKGRGNYVAVEVNKSVLTDLREVHFLSAQIGPVCFRSSNGDLVFLSMKKVTKGSVISATDLDAIFRGLDPKNVSNVGYSLGETDPRRFLGEAA